MPLAAYQGYLARVPVRTSPEILEFLRIQTGSRSAGTAIDYMIAWVSGDPARLAEFCSYAVEEQLAATERGDKPK